MTETPTPTEQQRGVAVPLMVNAQYLKDLSFENPNAPASLAPQNGQPDIQLRVDIGLRPLNAETTETVLQLHATAKIGERTAFIAEVSYAGVFTIREVPDAVKHQVLMIEAPRLLFPFARQILADAVQAGGFPPLLLTPLDFADMYRRNMMRPVGGDSPIPDEAAAAAEDESAEDVKLPPGMTVN